MGVESRRAVFIRYWRDGEQRRGSGLHVGGQFVLTADHCANGTSHVVLVAGQEYPAKLHVRSGTGVVDVAVLVAETLPDLPTLGCALVNREQALRIKDCQALGYPAWKGTPELPELAQPQGSVPTAEGRRPTEDFPAELLSFKIRDGEVKGHPVPNGLLDAPASVWAGMSGSAVLTADDLVIAVVRSHAFSEGGRSLTITPLDAINTLPREKSDMIWTALGVTDPASLPRLPLPMLAGRQVGPEVTNGATAESGVELSPDVVETHCSAFVSAGLAPPQRWSASELFRIVLTQEPSRLSDLVPALRRAVEAKPTLLEIGIGKLELARLQVIFRQEVGAWPNGASVDALLVEAAEVDRSEQRRGAASGLGALTRFVVGAAAALALPPQESPALADWIKSLGHQLADAQQHYLDRRGTPSWLLIDLGKEPKLSAVDDALAAMPPWPNRITWTYTTKQQSITGAVPAAATKEGLAAALKSVFSSIPPAWPLLVDIAMPVGLLSEGIEHWPLFDQSESLSDRYHPRLRWSQRRHDLVLHGRCADRAARSNASWNRIPKPIVDSVLCDETRLKRWIRMNEEHAWLIGRSPEVYRSDPLRVLLKEGFSFLIWFRQGPTTSQRKLIHTAVSEIPVAARRLQIPEELAGLPNVPAVIWDDPRGRGEFALPPPVAAEHIVQ